MIVLWLSILPSIPCRTPLPHPANHLQDGRHDGPTGRHLRLNAADGARATGSQESKGSGARDIQDFLIGPRDPGHPAAHGIDSAARRLPPISADHGHLPSVSSVRPSRHCSPLDEEDTGMEEGNGGTHGHHGSQDPALSDGGSDSSRSIPSRCSVESRIRDLEQSHMQSMQSLVDELVEIASQGESAGTDRTST